MNADTQSQLTRRSCEDLGLVQDLPRKDLGIAQYQRSIAKSLR